MKYKLNISINTDLCKWKFGPHTELFKRKIQTLRDFKGFYRSLHGFIPFMARVIVCFLVFYWVINVIISIAVVFHRRLQTSWKQLMSVLISSAYLLVLFWEAEMLLSLRLDYCFKVFWCEQKLQLSKHYLIDLKKNNVGKWVDKYLIIVLHKVIMCITRHLKWEEYIPLELETVLINIT